MMIDIKRKTQIDIDDEFKVHDFKQLIYDQGYFYLIANKRDNKLGFYLLKIQEFEPFGPK
jgi:DNA-binding cell septation regulator SpoVG